MPVKLKKSLYEQLHIKIKINSALLICFHASFRTFNTKHNTTITFFNCVTSI